MVGAVIILRKSAKFHLFLLFGFCSFVIPWAQENVPKYIKKSKACITQKAEKGKQWMQETKEETQKVLEQNRAPIQEELEKGKTFITQKAEQGKQWIKEQKEELQKVIKKTKAKLEKANEKLRLYATKRARNEKRALEEKIALLEKKIKKFESNAQMILMKNPPPKKRTI